MALSGVGLGTPQFYRDTTAQAAPQNYARQSQDLSDAVSALQAPAILPTPVRTSTGTQMATLCLVQPGDEPGTAGGSALNNALAAYATVFTD